MSDSQKKTKVTRRGFLRTQAALAAVAAAPIGSAAAFASAPTTEVAGVDYYDKLGVTKIINAAGTYTALTSATMPPSVRAAVALAALHPVRLAELQRKAGEYIAQKLKCEGCCISDGASAALSIATSAAIMAANGCRATDIPSKVGTPAVPKNEVIVQKIHRYGYDNAMFLCGIKVIEVSGIAEYKKAFGPNTVMTNFFNAADQQDISQEDWLSIAHSHGIPCHLDAAADMPPIANLWKFTGMSWDMVAFSGGKDIRGPQNSGLLLGKKKYTDLALASNFPADGVGRGMKVAKEQIVGIVAAVDWITSQSDESMEKESRDRMAVIIEKVKNIPTVKTSIMVPELANHVPHLMVEFDPAKIGASAREITARLASGTPAIELNPHSASVRPSQGVPAQPNALVVTTFLINPGEEVTIGDQIAKVLKDPKSVGTYTPAPQGQGGRGAGRGQGAGAGAAGAPRG